MEKKKILVTGGGGFIGHHFLKRVLEKTDMDIVAIYRKNNDRIPKSDRVQQVRADLTEPLNLDLGKLDYMVHMAAETYVDASLKDSLPFVRSNFVATANLLEWMKENHPRTKACLFSSDEVLGATPEGVYFTEDTLRKPSNPYSATKAGAEMLVYSFAHSFDMPLFTIRCMNVLGENESPEKFVPKVIRSVLDNKEITLHGTGKDNVASRHWIYAEDVADAVLFLLDHAEQKEIYHIAGEEMDVYQVSRIVYRTMKGEELPDDKVKFIDFHDARPGHDKRYSLSMEKLRKLGWSPKSGLEMCIKRVTKQLSEKMGRD